MAPFSSSLKAITIPQNVKFIAKFAFTLTSIQSMTVESGNEVFRVDGDFLVNVVQSKLVHGFNVGSHVTIPGFIKVLEHSCFESCKSLSSISFDLPSSLTRIESLVFQNTNLRDIALPSSVSFISYNAFPGFCKISLQLCEICPEFDQWRFRRERGSNDHFKRSVTLNDALRLVTERNVDLFKFERIGVLEESVNCENSPEMYRRKCDDFEVVLKSFPGLTHDKFESSVPELEILTRLNHPCITPLFGFVLPSNSTPVQIATP
jgi:hypothetical protein